MPAYGLSTPSQHPVVTIIGSNGVPIDVSKSASLTTVPAATNSLGILDPVVVGGSGATAWPAANTAIFKRFSLPIAQTARYFLVVIGTASGNVQYGVVKLSGTNRVNYTRVMDSGIIASPTAGNKRLDLGATVLEAGDYASFWWADNTTVTIPQSNNANYAVRRMGAEVAGLTGGVPASGTFAFGSRNIDVYLESDV